MPVRRILRSLVAIVVVTANAACDRPTAPAAVLAEYALVSLDSSALPTPPFSGAGMTILGDTIRLRADGTGERTVSYQVGNTRALHRDRAAVTWQSVGDSLEVALECRDTVLADCIPGPHLAGRIQAGMQWVIGRAVLYYGSAAVYQRLGMR